jgi:diguanylate cyclase (GGDEF)-like protein
MEPGLKRVLLAEDSRSQRAIVAGLLREEGLKVDEASDGRMALDLFRIARPDLVLLDIGLPGLDGWAVLDRIRADRKRSGTAVLMMTADLDEATALRALESGATDFVTKPIRQVELIARVRRALREQAAREALVARNRLLHQAAAIDALTGLPNRRASAEALAEVAAASLSTGGSLAVALIDVDHFKLVNDRYGHDAGDQVLCAIAGRLSDRARPRDIVGRWGGEEFIAVLPATSRDLGHAAAERLRTAAAAGPVLLDRHAIDVTVSVGWAFGTGEAPDELVKLADAALYAAKDSGRNCVRAAA